MLTVCKDQWHGGPSNVRTKHLKCPLVVGCIICHYSPHLGYSIQSDSDFTHSHEAVWSSLNVSCPGPCVVNLKCPASTPNNSLACILLSASIVQTLISCCCCFLLFQTFISLKIHDCLNFNAHFYSTRILRLFFINVLSLYLYTKNYNFMGRGTLWTRVNLYL